MSEQPTSLFYCAPEVLFGNYTSKSDLWSLGVIIYLLLTSRFPYETPESISNDKITYLKMEKRRISRSLRKFLKKLLKKDEAKRPSAK